MGLRLVKISFLVLRCLCCLFAALVPRCCPVPSSVYPAAIAEVFVPSAETHC